MLINTRNTSTKADFERIAIYKFHQRKPFFLSFRLKTPTFGQHFFKKEQYFWIISYFSEQECSRRATPKVYSGNK
jgi:hypothetical protein